MDINNSNGPLPGPDFFINHSSNFTTNIRLYRVEPEGYQNYQVISTDAILYKVNRDDDTAVNPSLKQQMNEFVADTQNRKLLKNGKLLTLANSAPNGVFNENDEVKVVNLSNGTTIELSFGSGVATGTNTAIPSKCNPCFTGDAIVKTDQGNVCIS